jgi:acyl-[acyl-carrier-protein]-phospholipid O-acyltransferase/long-chain-fatty-acid--[acyl-carrier-protein] ligase
MIPPRAFLRMCRRNLRRRKLADSTGTVLSGADLLMRTLILRRLLRRHVLQEGEKHVGLLLPPSVPAALANAALSIDGRVPINLNYTFTSAVTNECLARARIRHVITSRRVLEKFPLDLRAETVYLEDLPGKVTLADKLAAAFQARLMPLGMLERHLGLTRLGPDDLLTVIFTSGSTGTPKGVMLSHQNVASDVRAFCQVLRLNDEDVLLGILPFFHSFGFTTTLWTALMLDPSAVYHYTPLEAQQVGKLSRTHGATAMVATPTFLRSYLRRCDVGDFASMEMIITGAEKLPKELADAFEARFGVRPYEGYGTTELSPVVSTNVPPQRMTDGFQPGFKEGTVGRPLPGISAKVVHLQTGEDLGPDQSGMLMVKGPNVMQGYLDQPQLTAEVIRDGWYKTGDVAMIDHDGFIQITGRESRFSKIGGEMVPHLRIEEALNRMLSVDEDRIKLAVTSVPDARRGERLIVLHTGLDQPPEAIRRHLASVGLPPLWIPSQDSFYQVEAIPVLGTGKLDLKGVKDLALAMEK